ncbi:ABC transporter permease [Pseudooceanicola sp. 502str34]|uniref:ABC transporter permease n=1 Tax=Maritimibacter alkaliphilus TaxID=404236 RepID=UPI001C9610E3|nr:ABC transporter permease [Maritimibacter alkaliphilus]MBY6091009.1 ABC transporter permease [Maritimibacter alkaliphilus]
MLLFLIRRLLLIIPVLFGLLLLTFFMLRLGGNDPAAIMAGDNATPEMIARIREELGLNQPLVVQFWDYFLSVLRGDFGVSLFSQRPVSEDILDKLPATLELTLVALVIATVLGILLGTLAGVWRNSIFDHTVRIVSVAGLATASFWFAIMLQLVFAMGFEILPLRGRLPTGMAPPPDITGMYIFDSLVTGHFATMWQAVLHIIMPAVTISLGGVATVARFTRSAVVASLQSEYANYEQAVGYPRRRVVFPYVLRNSLVTPVTQVGLLFGGFISNAVAVEAVFDWPGLGSYLVQAIFTSDYQVVLAVTLVIGAIYGVVNILVDMTQGLLDPRVAEKM